jgi:hypothetical protein
MLHVVVGQDSLFEKELFELDKHPSFFQTVRFLRFLVHLVELLEVGIFKNCGYVLVHLTVEMVLVAL